MSRPMVVLKPRFQYLDVTSAATALLDTTEYIVGALRIRCAMRDCPSLGGDLGRVVVSRLPYLAPYNEELWEYQAPRGFVQSGERVWTISNRALRLLQRGEQPRGRTSHSGSGDWNTTDALTPFSMPGETFGIDDGLPITVMCPDPKCPRVMQFTVEDCRTALPR